METLIESFHRFCVWAVSCGSFSGVYSCATACPSLHLHVGGLSLSPEGSFDNACGNSVFNLSTLELNFSKTNSSESD